MSSATATKATKAKRGEQAESHVSDLKRPSTLSGPHADILSLQQTVGNQAVSQGLEASQRSEAPLDRNGQMGAEQNRTLNPLPSAAASLSDAKGLPSAVHSFLNSNGGQPLDPSTRTWMESRFGYDFGPVRIHKTSQAARSAKSVKAAAYTVGKDVVFGEGRYSPSSPTGRKLLAHELAHTIQQSPHGPESPTLSPQSHSEVSADSAANSAMNGSAVTQPGSTGVGVARRRSNVESSPLEADNEAAREASIDKTKAMLIGMLYDDSSLTHTSIFALIWYAKNLAGTFPTKDGPNTKVDPNGPEKKVGGGPKTRKASGRALLRIYEELLRRSRDAPRAADGALLLTEVLGGESPWTPARPHTIDDIPLFSKANLSRWALAALSMPEKGTPVPPRVRRVFPQKPGISRSSDVASRPHGETSGGGQPFSREDGVKEGGELVYTYTILKLPKMAWHTKEGRSHIVRAIIMQIWNQFGVPSDTWNYFEMETAISLSGAEQLWRGALDIATKVKGFEKKSPHKEMTDEQYFEYFANLAPGSSFQVRVATNFYRELSKHMPVPPHLVKGVPKSESRREIIARQEKEKLREEGKLPAPLQTQMYEKNSPKERLTFAMRQIVAAEKNGHNQYPPGVPNDRNWIFVYHPRGDESVWLAPDTSLWHLKDRELLLEGFRQGVLRSAGMVSLGNMILIACLAIMVAPAVGQIVGAIGRGIGQAGVGLVEGGKDLVFALRGVRSLPQFQRALSVYVGNNPMRALAIAELTFSTVANVAERGGRQSLKDLTTWQGATSLLFEILTAQQGGLKPGRPTGGPNPSRPSPSGHSAPDPPPRPPSNVHSIDEGTRGPRPSDKLPFDTPIRSIDSARTAPPKPSNPPPNTPEANVLPVPKRAAAAGGGGVSSLESSPPEASGSFPTVAMAGGKGRSKSRSGSNVTPIRHQRSSGQRETFKERQPQSLQKGQAGGKGPQKKSKTKKEKAKTDNEEIEELNNEIVELDKEQRKLKDKARNAYKLARKAKAKKSRGKKVSKKEQRLIDDHDQAMEKRAAGEAKLRKKKGRRKELSPPFLSKLFRKIWDDREKRGARILTKILGEGNVFKKPKIARVGNAELPIESTKESFSRLERSRLGFSSNEVTPENVIRLEDGTLVMVDMKGRGKHSWAGQKYTYEGLAEDGIGVVVYGRKGLPAGTTVEGKVLFLGPNELDQLAANPTMETLMKLLGQL